MSNYLFRVFAAIVSIALFSLPANAAEIKVAYVNAVKVIEEAPQAKAALKKLETEFGPRDKEIVEMQKEVKTIEEKLEKESLVLKSAEVRDLEKKLITLKRNLKREKLEFREDYNFRRNEELASLQKLVSRVIIEIAKAENYDLVLHEGTLYASNRVDITSKVLERLGKK